MNLEFTAEENAFRDEVREFIKNNYPENIEGRGVQDELSPEDMTAWHKILGRACSVACSQIIDSESLAR